ncbi:hypothetical protein [Archaeoglobus neptunius]|uniref:hypothetical protein n=1 Tax=Archaeoglobus neptunius TaxID=2798580 RepID=UPI001925B70A|nr:hypothetical protein [Archaeoglobus neptunius]
MKKYHQIYAEGRSFAEFFNLQEIIGNRYCPLTIMDFYGFIFRAIGKLNKEITGFRDDGRQYIIYLEGNIEVKFTSAHEFTTTPFGAKFWIHVSAEKLEDAVDVFDYIVFVVQEKVKEVAKDPS